MKKIAFVSIAILFVLIVLVSCNANICPAYVMEKQPAEMTLQENNS